MSTKMVKKNPRDPGAPKRNMSAYLLYQNAMREQFKALNPGELLYPCLPCLSFAYFHAESLLRNSF